jgi:hypothetical protein
MKPLKLITILGIAILISLPSLAFAKGKPPKPPVDPTVVYTVELTTGVFTFLAHEVTLNSRGYLKSLDTASLVFERPGNGFPAEQDAWDAVVNNCAGPLVGKLTDDVMYVDFDEWAVGRNGDDGNLWINFKNIRLPSPIDDPVPEKEIQIQLQLRDTPEITKTFLPTTPGSHQTFGLNWYVVWGKPLGGKGKNKGWDTCYQTDDGNTDVDFLPATLVIKYPDVIE